MSRRWRSIVPSLLLVLSAWLQSPMSVRAASPCDAVPGNLVQNCGFEQPVVGAGTYQWIQARQTTITGWTVGSAASANNGGDLTDQGYNAAFLGHFPVHGGAQSYDLNHDSQGAIFQDVATTAGQNYLLAFYLSALPACGDIFISPKTLTVTAGTTTQSFAFSPDPHASPPGNQQIVLETLTFGSTSSSTRLTFTSTSGSCTGPIIDDVSVTPTTQAGATGTIGGTVYANQVVPANVLQGAIVEACAGPVCAVTTSGADGTYSVGHLTAGTYTLTALPPPGGSLFSSGINAVTLATNSSVVGGQDMTLLSASPPPAGLSISSAFTTPSGIPVHFWTDPIIVRINAPAGSTVSARIRDLQGNVLGQGTLEDLGPAPPGSVTPFHIAPTGAVQPTAGGGGLDTFGHTYPPPYPSHGGFDTQFSCTCQAGGGGPDPQTPNDPSGTIVNQNGTPIPGATATLLRADSASGPFVALPSSSTQLAWYTPTDPETTDAQGRYGWDVYAGYYQVQASAPHCAAPGNPGQAAVLSDVKQVPPAVTGLTLTLQCTQVPAGLTITSPDSQASAATLSASLTEVGGPPIAGRSVTVVVTPTGGGTPLTQNGVTDANGNVRVPVTLALGTYAVSMTFTGDGNHLAASASQTQLLIGTLHALPAPNPSGTAQGGPLSPVPPPRPTSGSVGVPSPLPPSRP